MVSRAWIVVRMRHSLHRRRAHENSCNWPPRMQDRCHAIASAQGTTATTTPRRPRPASCPAARPSRRRPVNGSAAGVIRATICALVCLAELAVRGAHHRRQLDLLVDVSRRLGVLAVELDAANRHVLETGALEQLLERPVGREPEHPRPGRVRRLGVPERDHRLRGDRRPRVARGAVPDGERGLAAGAQNAADLVRGGLRIDDQHDPPAAQHRVDARRSAGRSTRARAARTRRCRCRPAPPERARPRASPRRRHSRSASRRDGSARRP